MILRWSGVMILSFLASASALVATPSSINHVLATAPDGAVIRLGPGNYGAVSIARRLWKRGVTIDASKATLNLNVTGSSGLVIRGGQFTGDPRNPMAGYAIVLRSSHNITFEGITVRDSKLGIAVNQSSGIRIRQARIVGMLADGIDIASSQDVVVSDSSCSDFRTEGQALHPDCMQMWSHPQQGLTRNITLERNRSTGPMQGFTGFNHVRGGVDDGGFENIVIRDNYVANTFPHGVYINACRNCTITGNVAVTLPGARWKTWVRAPDCVNCRIENNKDGQEPSALPK